MRKTNKEKWGKLWQQMRKCDKNDEKGWKLGQKQGKVRKIMMANEENWGKLGGQTRKSEESKDGKRGKLRQQTRKSETS